MTNSSLKTPKHSNVSHISESAYNSLTLYIHVQFFILKHLKNQIYSPSSTFNLHIEPKEDVTYDNEDTKISIYSHINNNDPSCESDRDYNEILPYEIKIENDFIELPDLIKKEKTDELISTVEDKPLRNKIDPSYIKLTILTPRQRKIEMKSMSIQNL